MNPRQKYWLGFNRIQGLGAVRIRAIWSHFGDMETAWKANAAQLSRVEGISGVQAGSISEQKIKIDPDREAESIAKYGLTLLTLEDNDYPDLLKEIYDPPPVLFIKGTLLPQDYIRSVAIVGTRTATPYGLKVAGELAHQLASAGVTVVSGMALGIDTHAHQGAIKAEGGRTLAVLGSSVERVSPVSNRKLYEAIIQQGAVLSEYPVGTPPNPWQFPQRNRIISGLSKGVVVVEGAEDSGALITAKAALEQNRVVFAVPGAVNSPMSKGANRLIKEGARLVESVEDIFEELNWKLFPVEKYRSAEREVHLEGDEKLLYSHLGAEPAHIDQLVRASGLPTSKVSALLLALELKGHVLQHPGKRYTRG